MTIRPVDVFTLPTVKSEVSKLWIDQKFLMIGPPKVGKSAFWSHGERTMYIQTEPGLNHLSVFKMVARSWDDFRNIYSALFKAYNDGKFPYDTLIIDTIDNFVDLANEQVIENGKEKFKSSDINTVGDIPNGAGWFQAKNLVNTALTKLSDLPCAVVLIGHLDNREVKMENNISIHKQTIALSPSIGKGICAWSDHIMNIEGGSKTGDRKVRVRPTGVIEAGSRGDMIPEDFTWTTNGKENYAKFRSFFKQEKDN